MLSFDNFLERSKARAQERLENRMSRLENTGGQTKNFVGAIRMLEISNFKKIILCDRFLSMLSTLESKANFYSRSYNYGSAITTIGALLVPAMLSIQSDENQIYVFWSTWSVALLTGLTNALLSLYGVPKKNVLFGKSLENLVSEGFKYLALTCSYETDEPAGHEDKFSDFLEAIERLHLVDVTKSYAKSTSNGSNSVGGDEQTGPDTKVLFDLHSNMVDSELNKLDEQEAKN